MLWPVKIVLGLLRVASEAILFFEAQRLVSHFVKPTSLAHVARAEDRLLAAGVKSSVRHIWVKCGSWKLHTIVAGEDENGSKNEGERKAMVLLHGHSMSGAFYYRNLDDMVGLGYVVYAVDLLGWGRSDRPKFEAKVNSMLEWYLNALERWRISIGLSQFALIGHSLGAYLAYSYSVRFQNRISKLMLICPAAVSKKITLLRAFYFKVSPHTVVRRGGLLGWLMFSSQYPTSEMYVRDCLRFYCYQLAALPASGDLSVSPMIRFRKWNTAEIRRPLIDNLGPVDIPIHIVCGETDTSVDVKDFHTLYEVMRKRGYNVRLDVIEGTDHCPHLENPEAFGLVLNKFDKSKVPVR